MQPSTDAVVASLADELVPLDPLDTADLAPVADALLSDDRNPPTNAHDEVTDAGSGGGSTDDTPVVIGMGEASHGTREFFTFKTRLIRQLVEERGVRLITIEANFAAVLAVNDYVTSGAGPVGGSLLVNGEDDATPENAAAALDRDGIHSVYQTDAVCELVEWVRSYNDGRPAAEQVRFHGVDVQAAEPAARRLRAYLDRPSITDSVDDALARLTDSDPFEANDPEVLRSRIETLDACLSTLGGALDADETRLVSDTSRRAYDLARRLVWTLDRHRAQLAGIVDDDASPLENVRVRDEAMAAQVEWLQDWTDTDRAVLWGHNAHLARHGFRSTDAPSLGSTLADADSPRYVAVGLTLGGGTVRSLYRPEDEFRDYEMDDPPQGSVPDLFCRVDPAACFVDLRTLSDDSPLSAWLGIEPSHLAIGGAYEDSPVRTVEYGLRDAFDALVFVRETTPARGLAE